ncbi:MAG: class I SAM-dependent methyltransferase [Bdellovibrionales bacterium]|nr:class I SAM-dependent methyltransferase [Bdellovibrionales bacterium]
MNDHSLKNWLLSQPELTNAFIENGRPYVVQKKGSEIEILKKTKQHERLWSRIFDLHYLQSAKVTDPEFDIGVWKSSYTGEAIPNVEMREWVKETVERVLKHCHSNTRVLEIGCGTGLLMYPILSHIQEYIGIDSSEEGLQRLISHSENHPLKARMQFYLKEASEISSLPIDKCDVVIINSVAQYFPSADYLLKTLKSLSSLLSDNAIIFIGDVRSYSLQSLLNLDVLLHRLPPTATIADLKKNLVDLALREKETLFHPRFFHLLNKSFPWIASVDTEVKRGEFKNEMHLFRYDVTIRVQEDSLSFPPEVVFDWKAELNAQGELERQLKNLNPISCAIVHVPNDRLQHLGPFKKLLQEMPETMNLLTLKELAETQADRRFDLQSLLLILKNHGYQCVVDCSSDIPSETLTLKCSKNAKIPASPAPSEKFSLSDCSNRPGSPDTNSEVLRNLQKKYHAAFPMETGFKEIIPVSEELIKIFGDIS